MYITNNNKYRSEKIDHLVMGALMVALIFSFKFIQLSTPFIPVFGVSIFPELFLIPVAISAIYLPWTMSTIVAFVGILSTLIIPSSGAFIIPAALPFDFIFPYLFFLVPGLIRLKYFKDKKKYEYLIYLNILLIVSNLLVTYSHTISGVLFFSNGANGSITPTSLGINIWIYSFLINITYGFVTLICSVILINAITSTIIFKNKHDNSFVKTK